MEWSYYRQDYKQNDEVVDLRLSHVSKNCAPLFDLFIRECVNEGLIAKARVIEAFFKADK
jgi:hypothetical protein